MPRKGENIYKRKDNRWEARYIKGYTADGAAQYGYCYAKSYREVKEKVVQARTAQQVISRRDANKNLSVYCDEWLTLIRNSAAESTIVKYTAILNKHIKPELGGMELSELTSVQVEQFAHKLLEQKKLSPKTVRDILSLLRSILKYASKQAPGTVPQVDFFYPKTSKTEIRTLTKAEQERLMRYLLIDMDSCKFGVLLALLTGMRIGEVCALRWQNISIPDQTILINTTMQRIKDLGAVGSGKTKIVISKPKTEHSARLIPLTDYTASLCKQWIAADPQAFILTGHAQRYMEPRSLQYKLQKYADACNIENLHFHVLRHTFATRCVEVGFEIKSLSEILGHASPRITMETYVHSSLELKRSNMEKLGVFAL